MRGLPATPGPHPAGDPGGSLAQNRAASESAGFAYPSGLRDRLLRPVCPAMARYAAPRVAKRGRQALG